MYCEQICKNIYETISINSNLYERGGQARFLFYYRYGEGGAKRKTWFYNSNNGKKFHFRSVKIVRDRCDIPSTSNSLLHQRDSVILTRLSTLLSFCREKERVNAVFRLYIPIRIKNIYISWHNRNLRSHYVRVHRDAYHCTLLMSSKLSTCLTELPIIWHFFLYPLTKLAMEYIKLHHIYQPFSYK